MGDKMNVDRIVRMSYWYPLLRDYSIESYSYRCSEKLVDEFVNGFFEAIDGDPFEVSARLLRKYRGLRGFLEKWNKLMKKIHKEIGLK